MSRSQSDVEPLEFRLLFGVRRGGVFAVVAAAVGVVGVTAGEVGDEVFVHVVAGVVVLQKIPHVWQKEGRGRAAKKKFANHDMTNFDNVHFDNALKTSKGFLTAIINAIKKVSYNNINDI